MIVKPTDIETHLTRSDFIGGLWFFSCAECSFEANYNPEFSRFQILVTGDPFVSHVCHHKLEHDYMGVRELVNELNLAAEEFEIEY